MSEYEPEPTKVLRRSVTDAQKIAAANVCMEWGISLASALLVYRAMWDAAEDEGLGPV